MSCIQCNKKNRLPGSSFCGKTCTKKYQDLCIDCFKNKKLAGQPVCAGCSNKYIAKLNNARNNYGHNNIVFSECPTCGLLFNHPGNKYCSDACRVYKGY